MADFFDKVFAALFVAYLFVLIIIIILLPTVIAFFLNRWLIKKGVKYIGLILLIAAPICTIYLIYTAINPTDKFYYDEFKEVTLREIPESAKIIRKSASYLDFHGDYCSASIIKLSKNDYRILLSELNNDSIIIKNAELIGNSQLNKILGEIRTEQIVYSFTRIIPEEGDHHLFIGFLDDNETIIVTICYT